MIFLIMAECRPKHDGHNTVKKIQVQSIQESSVQRRQSITTSQLYLRVFQGMHPVITPIHAPWFTGNNSYTTCERSPTLLSVTPCNVYCVGHRLYREIRVSVLTEREVELSFSKIKVFCFT